VSKGLLSNLEKSPMGSLIEDVPLRRRHARPPQSRARLAGSPDNKARRASAGLFAIRISATGAASIETSSKPN
jgi:hypothetical protein